MSGIESALPRKGGLRPRSKKDAQMQIYDEMRHEETVRAHYARFSRWLSTQSPETIARKRAEADLPFRRVGITFAVNGDLSRTERLIALYMLPRTSPRSEAGPPAPA